MAGKRMSRNQEGKRAGLSDFLLHASKEEKLRIFVKIGYMVNKEQQKIFLNVLGKTQERGILNPMAAVKKESFKEQLKEIGDILAWFDAQEELDVEAALAKIKKAGELIKASGKRLTEIENEFKEVKGE